MIEFRLVLDVEKRHWGSEGLTFNERYYFLQIREITNCVVGLWKTLPVVLHDELEPPAKLELLKAVSKTGAYGPSATCKHGIHPYDCKFCDPYSLKSVDDHPV